MTDPTDMEIDAVVQACRERGLRELDVFRAVLAKWGTPPVVPDTTVMQLAESVGLIGPASRTNDLHAAIQRFHDLICANATIKAAQMAAEAISESAPQQAQEVSMSEAKALAAMAARWFDAAGFNIAFSCLPSDIAREGASASAGFLAAVELRDLLAQSPEGRQALRDLGFESVPPDLHR